MVFRNYFNEPRPKGFLEIGEVLEELDIDPTDEEHLNVVIEFSCRSGPKFNELTDGFCAEVSYSDLDEWGEEVTKFFTTLGYRSLQELKNDLASVGFTTVHENLLTQERDVIIRDEPDEPTVSTIVSKTEDFADIRDANTKPILAFVREDIYAAKPSSLTEHLEIPGDRKIEESVPVEKTTELSFTINIQENPDMSFTKEIFTMAGALAAATQRAQNELLEVNRIATALMNAAGNNAFEANEEDHSINITLNVDTTPITEALEEINRVTKGLDADAQGAVEGVSADFVETKEIIEEAANKATEEVLKRESDDFDAAVERALAAGMAPELAVEVPSDEPKELPVSPVTKPGVVNTPEEKSDDLKDFCAIVQFFLNNHTGERDFLQIETSIFNVTWDHGARKIHSGLSKYLVKVPNSKMIWTQRLNSLFKKFVGTHVDAVLYGNTTPTTMRLDRDADGTYSFVKA